MKSVILVGLICFIFPCRLCTDTTTADRQQYSDRNGHLKRFGSEGPSYSIDELYGFPAQKHFFKNYVLASKPLKMAGAARMSPAFSLWSSDDYFLSLELDVPRSEQTIQVETKKKENRTANVVSMNFHDFIKIYNGTEYYMVSAVPTFLGPDVLVPCSLQCQDILEKNLVATMMWFSSGGTKSVVHTDAVDNINCLYRGEKEFVMVDPKYQDKVDMDHPEGSYCGVDVDSVDYEKYPGLAEVEYYHVNMSAGDCLFIPYMWIHQVRSYNSNIAVNLWWDHYKSQDIDIESCDTVCDNGLTLDQLDFHGFKKVVNSVGIIRDHFRSTLLSFKTMTLQTLFHAVQLEIPEDQKDLKEKYNQLVSQLFKILDLNEDGEFTMEELNQIPDTGSEKCWKIVQKYVSEIEQLEEDIDDDELSEDDDRTADTEDDNLSEDHQLRDEL
ncbi:uncharacterized protein LOC121371008 [Gigantopelta aegis]|uniref:uncharacterized protein LOC121371008 n=1 Tax=Gigantopelta aegis TaxID=1735272 RepID=UPI001B887ACA|nr:uncharacterized protein LOC121371008 [Gigantopelta aegis]